MTALIDGVQLTLLAGPLAPLPAPAAVIDALTSVRVTVATRQAMEGLEPSLHRRSGFQLQFSLAKRSPLEGLLALTGGAAPPLLRIVLAVTIQGQPEVLIDGFALHHDIEPGGGSASSIVTVSGVDLTAAMDLVAFDGLPYPGLPVAARVAALLAKYAPLGVVPVVVPPVLADVPDPSERMPAHRGTDLKYVSQLAADHGYVFYLEPGPVPRANKAYWGPEIKVAAPQPARSGDPQPVPTAR